MAAVRPQAGRNRRRIQHLKRDVRLQVLILTIEQGLSSVAGAGLKAKNPIPVVLDVDNGPSTSWAFVEPTRQTGKASVAVIGIFAVRIVMMDDQTEARSRSASDPFEHREIAVRIAKGGDGTPPDMGVDRDGLAFLVAKEVQLGLAHERRLAVLDDISGDDAAADHLLGRNAIDGIAEGAHELDAAAGDDRPVSNVFINDILRGAQWVGIGPKKIRMTLSRPITRTSSCMVQ